MKKLLKKILIIEDDDWLADNYQLILRKDGWQTSLCSEATKAIDMIDEFEPDVILLDYMLPGKHAPTLLNELQSHVDTASLPIVLCTSLSLSELSGTALSHYGIQEVIDKTTTTPEEMLEIMNKFFTHAAA